MFKKKLFNIINKYLPMGSQIIVEEDNNNEPLIIRADLNGYGLGEIIVAYRWQGENYVMVLERYYNQWCVIDNIKGKGYDISYLKVAPITDNTIDNLIIGWRRGAIWSELDILQWTPYGFKRVIDEGIYYSKVEVENMKSVKAMNGKNEIALWLHDTAEAYKVEVYRWSLGKLVKAEDVYPYYFEKVIDFYKRKVKEEPDFPVYWYYLADAQVKGKMYEDALKSIDKALEIPKAYPSKRELLKLKDYILSSIKCKNISLYPAPINTIKGAKWGYINEKGEFLIKPIYDLALEFQCNGLAVVEIDNFYGIIDDNGDYIVKHKYGFISEFSEGRAIVIDNERFNIINEKGDELISKTQNYSYIGNFKEGRAQYGIIDPNKGYLYGYLDRDGKDIIPAQYEYANDFYKEKAVVRIKENEYALINVDGEILNKYEYASVGNLREGLLSFKEDIGGKYGFIDEDGNVVIKPQFTYAQDFSEGRAVVNASGNIINNYGVIDKEGNYIITPKYNDIILLGDNRMAVGIAIDKTSPFIGSKYAIADTEGNILTDFIYYGVSNYKNGIASVYDNSNTFFIDKEGNKVENLPVVEGSGTLTIENELIKAYVDYRISYFDIEGNLIWEENSVIHLNDQYKVIEEKYKPNKDYLVYYPKLKGMEDKTLEDEVNNRLKILSEVKPIEENVQLEYSYLGDFKIEFFDKNLLVLELHGYNFPFGAAHGMPSKIYAKIDLTTGEFYELKDLFKEDSDYVKVLSDIIGEQIKNNPEYSYIFPDSYNGIKEDQPFYVSKDALYIYFYPYEIAPYAAGFPTFKIPYEDIMNIINQLGEFWRSFN
ncbi:WG repeat-containing protein [Clostridium sporogenes]|nr:WG repeat-containing protein [Clostridium sporogenes]KRU41371.1 WG repeat-containing protein [Clostridium sporogenes]MBY7013914.1 WG repeat-containing protein [Clostridium sporogenes]MBY7063217.1 WG repeat-containing protein [Clostridium sporogenes]MBY7068723.1 WG repeat-containing protein [Clostridium sporogenes]MCW6066189.1 WG repeat-containing protein [Clostridium sporogenes]